MTAAAAAAAEPDAGGLPRLDHQRPGGVGAYPISSFTWLLLYEDPQDKTQGRQMMVDFLQWALTDGQKLAPELGYAPLPQAGRRYRTESARHS